MAMQGYTTWVEVNLGTLKHNLTEVRNTVGASVRIMAVVKADGYGHGLVEAARAFADAGADCLGVTTVEEGIRLRDAGIGQPILAFSPLLPDQMEAALLADVDQTICDPGLAEALSSTATRLGKTARVHAKVDTGMGRLGILADDCIEFMYRLLNLKRIEITGIYTHFAEAGVQDPAGAREQNKHFSGLLENLSAKDIPVGLRHAANSAAILNLPGARYDMVRPGTILYGQYPTRYLDGMLSLRETWCLKTRIVSLRRLPAGTKVGYGSEYATARPTLSAVIPVGSADGFTLVPESVARRAGRPLRVLANRLMGGKTGPSVTVRGSKAPVIGRVSMQMCSVDVTDIPEVRVGDEVIVPARRTTTSSAIPRVVLDG